jgi:hypothetical protein
MPFDLQIVRSAIKDHTPLVVHGDNTLKKTAIVTPFYGHETRQWTKTADQGQNRDDKE